MNLLPSQCILCTPYNHAPCHFMQSHIRKVYVCLAVTCHLHFWQNDRDLLHAAAVTRGWNGHWNKSQHRKLTLEKKILLLLLLGFEPATFQSFSSLTLLLHSYMFPQYSSQGMAVGVSAASSLSFLLHSDVSSVQSRNGCKCTASSICSFTVV